MGMINMCNNCAKMLCEYRDKRKECKDKVRFINTKNYGEVKKYDNNR